MELIAGRVARVHGLRGEVLVEVRTDDPDERFAVGAVLRTEPAERGPLTVAASRWHSGRLLLRFAEIPDRTAAEALPGVRLVVDVAGSAGHDDEYYDYELEGLTAVDAAGAKLGTVVEVLHHTGQELLVLRRTGRADALVPFVAAIVTDVDLVAARVVLDPPVGLLDDEEAAPDGSGAQSDDDVPAQDGSGAHSDDDEAAPHGSGAHSDDETAGAPGPGRPAGVSRDADPRAAGADGDRPGAG